MTFLLVLFSLVALLWLWIVISPAHRVTFRDQLNAGTAISAAHSLPGVSVIIPARNEAAMLPDTLPSICRQDQADLQVLVINDQSDDDSASVLAAMQKSHPNLTVIEGIPRPAGWMGKNWAVHQGYKQAKHNWLLFTDADVVYHPQAVAQAMAWMIEHDIDMLTLMPRVTFGRAIERIGVAGMVTLMALLFPVGRANNPRRRIALGIGMFILCRRSAYEKIGGHEAIRGTIIEDMLLAKVFKQSAAKTEVRFTSDLLTTRMYDGWRDLWEGLTKNAYASVNFSPLKLGGLLVVGMLVGALAPVYLLASIGWWVVWPTSQTLALMGLCLWINVAMAVFHGRCARYLRLNWYYGWMMSVSIGLYIVIGAWSAWKHHFGGGHTWKGRKYEKEVVTEAHG